MSREELLKIRNFGEKSYTELYDKLRENELLPPELDPALANAEDEVEEEAPDQTQGEQVAQEQS